jgi:hypothetical protein
MPAEFRSENSQTVQPATPLHASALLGFHDPVANAQFIGGRHREFQK